MKIIARNGVESVVGVITVDSDKVVCVRLIRANDKDAPVRVYLDDVQIAGTSQDKRPEYISEDLELEWSMDIQEDGDESH